MIADIDAKAGEETARAINAAGGGKAVFQRLEVTDTQAAAAAVEATIAKLGRLDIHVNNAGVVNRAPFLEYTLPAWQKVIDVNLTGAFICGQASARAMAKAGRGSIVNISSISGQQGGTGRVAYGASKAGIISLTQTMAMELGPLGITVNAIAPGPTQVSRLSHGPKQRKCVSVAHGAQEVCLACRHRRRGRVPRLGRCQPHHRSRAQRGRRFRRRRRAVRPG